MEEEVSEGSGSARAGFDRPDASEGSEVSEDSDEWDGTEGSGWFADPDIEGQERYFDGSEWTSETRPADPDAPPPHLPEHTGELQRALAAATADIDEVEDRLGNLFDRAEQHGERGGRARKQAAEQHRATDSRAEAADEGAEDWEDRADQSGWGLGGDIEAGADEFADSDDDALAELDEALASEEPEKVKRNLFRRRS